MCAGVAWRTIVNQNKANERAVVEQNYDKYGKFVDEVYTKIQENYWDKITDDQLSKLFLLASKKVTNNDQWTLKSNDKSGVAAMWHEVLKSVEETKKATMTAGMVDVVLANLEPFGRSRLYSQDNTGSLSQTINNINPEVNRFEQLGINAKASDKEVKEAYENKIVEATSAAEKQVINEAYEVLKDSQNRERYEINGAEPTVEYRLIDPEIFYMRIIKFSPTTLNEFVEAANKMSDKGEELDTLILDLRDNIGGAIDSLPYFLGPFIGQDNYAYQFYQQGNKEDFKTVTGWLDSLVRYKKVVILVNEQTQSTAEVMTAVLKKYNVGVVMGTKTKGWGTVEKVFSLDNQIDEQEKFSLYLVHHLTVSDDGLAIEGRGIEPMIDINQNNWKKELLKRFDNQKIVNTIEDLWKNN